MANNVRVRIPAKVNLTLDVTGRVESFHTLDSIFASISIYDTIVLKKRNDSGISLAFSGDVGGIVKEKTNAYRVAQMIINKYGTNGAEIKIERGITCGGGLGGSSADAAGVINGLAQLYGIDDENGLDEIANSIGSDVAYMRKGGFARVRGRGELVERIPIEKKFYYIVIDAKNSISTKDCFALYDKEEKKTLPCTEDALKCLYANDYKGFFEKIKNDLYAPACKLLPEISENLSDLKQYGMAVMTGSGSSVIGIYEEKKIRDDAYTKLKNKYGSRIYMADGV